MVSSTVARRDPPDKGNNEKATFPNGQLMSRDDDNVRFVSDVVPSFAELGGGIIPITTAVLVLPASRKSRRSEQLISLLLVIFKAVSNDGFVSRVLGEDDNRNESTEHVCLLLQMNNTVKNTNTEKSCKHLLI